MHNVEKNFFVVGVLEQFDDTLHLFEKLLPRFFNGATEVYHSDSKLYKPFGSWFYVSGNVLFQNGVLEICRSIDRSTQP